MDASFVDSAPPPTGRVHDISLSVAEWASRSQWILGVFAVVGLVLATVLSTDRLVRRQTRWPGDIWEKNASGLLPLALGAAVVVEALAGTTAVNLIPAWSSWHAWVDRHVYGERSRPTVVLAQLGRQLSVARSSDDAVQGLVDTIAAALKLPYVAVELDLGEDIEPVIEASYGTRGTYEDRFPIAYSSEPLGQLVVGPRTDGEALREIDREVLSDLAGHVGVVLHDTYLEAQLRVSREQIVRTREAACPHCSRNSGRTSASPSPTSAVSSTACGRRRSTSSA